MRYVKPSGDESYNAGKNRLRLANRSDKLRQKAAFTMAEVLITLGIVGIVAAMTLPSLINKARYKALETGLKRSYSLLGQALDMYQAQNGERLVTGFMDKYEMKDSLMKYFNVVRDCGFGSFEQDACIPNFGPDMATNSQIYKTFNGHRVISLQEMDDGQFVINDASLILIEYVRNVRLYISVDVNGYNKNPNRLGQDLFMFEIDKKGRLLPMGVEGTAYYSITDEYCSSTSTNSMNGAACTYKALTDKDYFKNLPK